MQDSNKTETITAEIRSLFELYGNADYDGEPVSQTSHMIQCGMRAMSEGADTELILGSFLHDIGHLLRHVKQVEAMGGFGVVNHEGLGAAFLRNKGFSERIYAMVENHVAAKRYLVATVPGYFDKLSPASIETLKLQGGVMGENEISLFQQHPFFEDIIKVRTWDEEAKNKNAVLLPLNHFMVLITQYLKDCKNI